MMGLIGTERGGRRVRLRRERKNQKKREGFRKQCLDHVKEKEGP